MAPWRSENNFLKLVLSYYLYMDSRDQEMSRLVQCLFTEVVLLTPRLTF